MAETMSDDEKLKLRRVWEKFKDTGLVKEIIKLDGGDVVRFVDENTTNHTVYYENFLKFFKETTFADDVVNSAIKSAKDAVDSVIELITVFNESSSSKDSKDSEIKKTRTNIERANTEMGKIVVGNTKLLYNLNNYKTAIELDSLISGVSDDDDDDVIDQYKFRTAVSESIWFSNLNLTEENKINKLSSFVDKPNDEIIKLIKEILPNTSPKLRPAPPQGPLHITIKGNKYSIGSKDGGSHEMNYDNVTKCWKEKAAASGGATKSKKKRGPKSRAKSRAKSRPKSRRY